LWIDFILNLSSPCVFRNQRNEAKADGSAKADASASTQEGDTVASTPEGDTVAATQEDDTVASTPEGDAAAHTLEVDAPKEQKEQTASSPLGNFFKRMGNFFITR
jgi:hypothetical protein